MIAEIGLGLSLLQYLGGRDRDEIQVAIATLQDPGASKANQLWARGAIQRRATELRRSDQRRGGFSG